MSEMHFGSLSLTAPEGWQDASTISLVGPEREGASPNIMLSRDPGGGTDMVAYAAAQAQTLQSHTQEYAQHLQEKRLIAGQNAVVVEHTFVMEGAGKVRQLQAYIRAGGGALTVTCTHADAHFEGQREVFEAALSTLKLG